MKRIFTFLTALFFLSLQKSVSQTCVSLNCAAAHTGVATNTTGLPDSPGSDIGNACYNGATYRQVFWEFFESTGGNFAQTFTSTNATLDLDWFVYDIGVVPPNMTCPVTGAAAPGGWTVVACDNQGSAGAATGPGVADGQGANIVATTAKDFYAVAIVVYQSINTTFDIGAPTLNGAALTGANCPAAQQTCNSLNCAAAHTGVLTLTTGLSDSPGSDLGNACYNGSTYKQVFWEFFLSTGGNFAQTFTPTVPADNLDIDWFVYDVGLTAPSITCPVTGAHAPGGWTVVACDNLGPLGQPTGPGVADGQGANIVPTAAGDYYAVAMVVYQSINATFDIGVPSLNGSALTSANCPTVILPVKLSSFSSTVNNCVVNLNWTSLSETDFKDYQVEYSTDGRNFRTIADIAALGTGTDQHYSYQHANPQQGKAFYRLRMVDLNGNFEYSKTLAMKMDCRKAQMFVYPNPVKDLLNVNITNSQGVIAKMFDGNGKLIYTGNMISGSNTINMGKFAKGTYLLKLINTQEVQVLKILKQ
ncbi:MAG: hypothetical protein C5B54_00530 [Acidobacteria bacterium]|nr:MAG: hypothetical protein C5B54_00530 [Acidobacteriota bacterium]